MTKMAKGASIYFSKIYIVVYRYHSRPQIQKCH